MNPTDNVPAAAVVLPDGLTGVLLLGTLSRLSTTLALHASDNALQDELACDDGDAGSERLRLCYDELARESLKAIRLLERVVGDEVRRANTSG